jgi:hypothetical protein
MRRLILIACMLASWVPGSSLAESAPTEVVCYMPAGTWRFLRSQTTIFANGQWYVSPYGGTDDEDAVFVLPLPKGTKPPFKVILGRAGENEDVACKEARP